MRIKKETRYGEHHFTTVEATIDKAAGEHVWCSEHEIALNHNALRRAIKRAIRDLTEVDERLEANVKNGADVAKLLEGINTLGILQDTGREVDSEVRLTKAAIDAHKRLLAALNASTDQD